MKLNIISQNIVFFLYHNFFLTLCSFSFLFRRRNFIFARFFIFSYWCLRIICILWRSSIINTILCLLLWSGSLNFLIQWLFLVVWCSRRTSSSWSIKSRRSSSITLTSLWVFLVIISNIKEISKELQSATARIWPRWFWLFRFGYSRSRGFRCFLLYK